MSAIIDIDFPNHCSRCELNHLDWDRCRIISGCPVKADVPNKHGRLIDANQLITKIWEADLGFGIINEKIIDIISEMPTIIEEEK